jgi:nitroreductase
VVWLFLMAMTSELRRPHIRSRDHRRCARGECLSAMAGHVAQNILLASTGRGIGTCPIGGFVDTAIVELLDLTGDEIPVYVIAAGETGSLG